MRPQDKMLASLRQPTEKEKAWVSEHWLPEKQRLRRTNRGAMPRYIGIALICLGAVSLILTPAALSETVVVLICGAFCLLFASAGRKASKQSEGRIDALRQGSYQVAPVVTTKIGNTANSIGGAQNPWVKLRLPDGEPLPGVYQIPYACAHPLLQQRINVVPALLIRISGDPNLLAVPAPPEEEWNTVKNHAK